MNTCVLNTSFWRSSTLLNGNLVGLNNSPPHPHRFKSKTRLFSIQSSTNKAKRDKKSRKDVTLPIPSNPTIAAGVSSEDDGIEDGTAILTVTVPTRRTVLTACTVTSGLISASGLIIRQVSHFASSGGWPVIDFSTEVPFTFETWHLELIAGLVVLISSCRYLLLKTWADFAESSEAANQQVLTSLEPLDYMAVAFLPGFSEEILFRGAIQPLFGMNWKSALVVATIFGVLHLGSGRKYSFALWATFVGFLYGYATIVSSSIIVPMVSHALNNLVGGILWRYSSTSR